MPSPKTHTVRKNFRLTSAEAARLSKHAAKAGVTESDYVRTLINDPSHVFVTEGDVLRDVYRELKRQGVNLNQIAYVVNAGRASSLDRSALDSLAKRISDALAKLSDIIDAMKKARHADR